MKNCTEYFLSEVIHPYDRVILVPFQKYIYTKYTVIYLLQKQIIFSGHFALV